MSYARNVLSAAPHYTYASYGCKAMMSPRPAETRYTTDITGIIEKVTCLSSCSVRKVQKAGRGESWRGDWIPEYADRLAGVIIRADRSRTTGEVLSKLAHARLRMHKKPFESR